VVKGVGLLVAGTVSSLRSYPGAGNFSVSGEKNIAATTDAIFSGRMDSLVITTAVSIPQ